MSDACLFMREHKCVLNPNIPLPKPVQPARGFAKNTSMSLRTGVPVSSLRNVTSGRPTLKLRTYFINAASLIRLAALELDSSLTRGPIGNVLMEYVG